MRIYLPATQSLLQELSRSGVLAPPLTAFAVTAGFREWYRDDEDVEALEYAAFSEAARASLRLLDADPAAARRRVVVALDARDADVEVRDDIDRGVVRVRAPVAMSDVASIHADDPDADDAVAEAAHAIIAADLGDDAAQDLVDDAEGFELSWYATQELDSLLEQLRTRR